MQSSISLILLFSTDASWSAAASLADDGSVRASNFRFNSLDKFLVKFKRFQQLHAVPLTGSYLLFIDEDSAWSTELASLDTACEPSQPEHMQVVSFPTYIPSPFRLVISGF